LNGQSLSAPEAFEGAALPVVTPDATEKGRTHSGIFLTRRKTPLTFGGRRVAALDQTGKEAEVSAWRRLGAR
jgi:hypothetical protein